MTFRQVFTASKIYLLRCVDTGGASPYDMRFLSGAIAQLGERLHGMQEVGGSIPPSSTKISKETVLGPHRLEA